jgi:hypothetical protein
MNLILEKTDQVRYFTEMGSVFRALGISPRDYDWYLSDLEINHSPVGFEAVDQWLTGEELHRLINEHEIQFIWGVFSAVPKGLRCDVDNPPFADGNPKYWEPPECKPQLKGALFEIVSWDSGATILVGVDAQAGANFVKAYSDAKPLSQ